MFGRCIFNLIRNCLTVYTSFIYLHFIQLRITVVFEKDGLQIWGDGGLKGCF